MWSRGNLSLIAVLAFFARNPNVFHPALRNKTGKWKNRYRFVDVFYKSYCGITAWKANLQVHFGEETSTWTGPNLGYFLERQWRKHVHETLDEGIQIEI